LASDRWFCWEQPDRDFALAALGVVHEAASRGPGRFRDLARECLGVEAVSDEPPGLPAGAGAVWVGGFAFDPHGGSTSPWSTLPPASLALPELSLCRSGGQTHLTLNAAVRPGDDPDEVEARMRARLAGLREESLPLLDPHPTSPVEITSVRPPGDFERAVAAATERIEAGEMSKIVLAREVLVTAPAAHDPAAIFGALREQFSSCFCFCCGTPEAAFLGASPELLLRRSGASVSTVALAGSTRRSSDPAVDDHLGEQLLRSDKDRREHEIVAERIAHSLRPHSVWVQSAAEPEIVKVANIQHLATPVVAQLVEPRSAVELAGMLHPTPAVGGEPWPAAAAAIASLEQMDRGWYAGPVGWMDATEDGEFCVALRSALLRDREARLYAGVGVVAGSDPAAELAETEVKLDALLPLLSE
jgi:salicylate biosynthesis isochorismate synthase/menaquinone-specific isochorismate synthase